MQEIIIQLLNQYGYIGVCLLIAIENIFPPIPSEVILTFGGFMTTYTNLQIPLMILFSTLGSVLGALVLYYIGKIFNKERLKKLAQGKVGKILRFKASDIEKADTWFDKKGNRTVLFCRFIPIVRSLISIPAGMSEMPVFKFLFYTTVGTIIWNSVLIILGSAMGNHWSRIVIIMNQFSHLILIVFIFLFLLFLGWFYYFRSKKKK